ncbi:hypothetical protein BSIN_0060 [Burkholderia singularis]|uniref:Uncharacterized protein n=1 Tax=Burkholderia singularis TaxID=1503053 RepID=A0A238H2G2_9BURK|nr:hypothetical protein BSIN_0060 [Burkholderia singularis]
MPESDVDAPRPIPHKRKRPALKQSRPLFRMRRCGATAGR